MLEKNMRLALEKGRGGVSSVCLARGGRFVGERG